MDWQQAAALGIVALGVVLMGLARWRRRAAGGCGAGCCGGRPRPLEKRGVDAAARGAGEN